MEENNDRDRNQRQRSRLRLRQRHGLRKQRRRKLLCRSSLLDPILSRLTPTPCSIFTPCVPQLYSTWTFQNVGSLKGHNGRVRSLCWSADDTRLVSCGIDGAVYEWDVATKQRSSECVLKSCNYTSAVISPDGANIYAVGSDRTLKEIRDNVVQLDVPSKSSTSPEVALTQVALSGSGRMLVAGTAQGAVRSFKYPLSVPGDWTALASHVGAITRVRMSMDDQFLFTVGDDGCLFIYHLSDKDGRGARRDPASGFAEEVLIGRADLAEKNALTNEVRRGEEKGREGARRHGRGGRGEGRRGEERGEGKGEARWAIVALQGQGGLSM